MATETKTFYPGEYDASISSYNSLNNPTNAVGKGSDNTSVYTQIGAKSGKSANCYWPFDVSAIPMGAEIESVSCVARAARSTSSGMTASLQLSAGTSLKGSSVSVNSTSSQKYTIPAGAWTRSELETIRLRTYATASTTSGRSILFYGADLTVTYTYQSEKFMLKLGGKYNDVARVFKKITGIWVEQTNLANVIEDGVRYQNGGEIESTGPTLISFTMTGGLSWQAEEGMTWGEWIDSEYATANSGVTFEPTSNSIEVYQNGRWWGTLTDQSENFIKTADKIVGGYNYWIV